MSHPFEVVDTAPFICIMREQPTIAYGPMSVEEAMDFVCEWNEWFSKRDIPGTWQAIPVVQPASKVMK